MTERLGYALLYAFLGWVVCALFTGALIEPLRRLKLQQIVREDGPGTHLQKTGTPSMGGIAIITALVLISLISYPWLSPRAFLLLGFVVATALVGLSDDLQKFRRRGAYGFGARVRILVELALALLLVWMLRGQVAEHEVPTLRLLFIPAAGALWLAFAAFVLVGSANAVNLTDGLDGLAAGLVGLCALALAAGCAVTRQPDLAFLSLLVAGVAGGFLWYNASPARIFMGDVGSLGLGAAVGSIAIAARLELVLLVVGLIFVAETLSVIGQVVSFRTTGRRLLKMAPLHHHFELCGWPEQTVVVRFWVAGAWLCAVACMMSIWGSALWR